MKWGFYNSSFFDKINSKHPSIYPIPPPDNSPGRSRPQGLHPEHDFGRVSGRRRPPCRRRHAGRVRNGLRLRRSDQGARPPCPFVGRHPAGRGHQQAGHGVVVAGPIRRHRAEAATVPEAGRLQGQRCGIRPVQRADGTEPRRGADRERAAVMVWRAVSHRCDRWVWWNLTSYNK